MREVNAEMSSEGRTTVTVTATLFKARYAVLLDTAEELREHGYHEAAIVMAHTAPSTDFFREFPYYFQPVR